MSKKSMFFGGVFAAVQGIILDTVNRYFNINCLSPLEDNNADSLTSISNSGNSDQSLFDSGQYIYQMSANGGEVSYIWTYFNLIPYKHYRFIFDVRSPNVTTTGLWVRQIYWGTLEQTPTFDISTEWQTITYDVYNKSGTSQAIWVYTRGYGQVSNAGDILELRNFKLYEILNVFTPFITTWETTTADEVVTIPLSSSDVYNFIVDWGDGSKNTYSGTGNGSTCLPTHTYAVTGSYDVSIEGIFPRILFNNVGDKLKIKDVKQWGEVVWQSMSGAFYGCANMDITATDVPNLTNVTIMQNAFRICNGLVNLPLLGSWDMSNIVHLGGTFRDTNNLNLSTSGIENWNTQNLQELGTTFLYSNLNNNLGNWNIQDVDNGVLFNLNGNDWSTANYDATLIGWAAQAPNIQSNVTFDMGSTNRTSASASAYALLTGTYGWTINDNGQI